MPAQWGFGRKSSFLEDEIAAKVEEIEVKKHI